MRRVLAVLLVVLVLGSGLASSVSILGVPSATLNGPATVAAGKTITFSGRYTAGGVGLAGQEVVLVDVTTPVATTTTSSNGGFSFAVALDFGSHYLRARAEGPGLLSADSPTITVRAVEPPTQPLLLDPTRGPTVMGVTLDWEPPIYDTLRPVDIYVVRKLIASSWVRLDTLPGTARSYLDSGAWVGENRYRLAGANAAGEGFPVERTITLTAIATSSVPIAAPTANVCWIDGAGVDRGCWNYAEDEEITYPPFDTSQLRVTLLARGTVRAGSYVVPNEVVDAATALDCVPACPSAQPGTASGQRLSDAMGAWQIALGPFTWTPPPTYTGTCETWRFQTTAEAAGIPSSRTSHFPVCQH